MDEQLQKNFNFGKVIAKLNLEEKVLKNGIIPSKSLAERGEIVKGIVSGLLEKGSWKNAIDLVFNEGPARMLYEGDKNDFFKEVEQTIKPKDFRYDSQDGFSHAERETINLLIKNGGVQVVYNTALRPDVDPLVGKNLLEETKNYLDKETLKKEFNDLGTRIQKTHPQIAYDSFKEAENLFAINKLYTQLSKNFALEQYFLLKDITENKSFSPEEKKLRVKQIAHLVLNNKKEEGEKKIGKDLFDFVHNNKGELNKKDTKKLNRLTAKELHFYELDSSLPNAYLRKHYQVLKEDWAKTHWQEDPINAYRIFNEQNKEGKLVLKCAKKAVEKMYDARSNDTRRVDIKIAHLKEIYSRIPKSKVDLRRKLAEKLEDKEELKRIAAEYANKGNNKYAYQLLFNADISEKDPEITRVREKYIVESFKKAEQEKSNPYFGWLDPKDKPGYEQVYNQLLQKDRPGLAFELAQKYKDITRANESRKLILEKNNPESAFKFFKDEKDKAGYDLALNALVTKYGLSKEDLVHIVDIVNHKSL